MQFNPYDYDETYVMHCASKEEAREFAEYLEGLGFKDSNPGYSLFLRGNGWSNYGGGTCYRFNAGKIGSLDDYRHCIHSFNPVILEFRDFTWGDCDISLSFDEAFKEMLE